MPRNVRLDPDFPRRLRALRQRAHFTQSELAERAGVHYRTVHDLEKGSRTHAMERTLMDLAKALGISFAELVGREEIDGPSEAAVHLEGDSEKETESGRRVAEADRYFFSSLVRNRRFVVALSLLAFAAAVIAIARLPRTESSRQVARSRSANGRQHATRPEEDSARTPVKDAPIMKVTTKVPCAYRAFVEGMHYWRMLYREQARNSFMEAIKCDSTFAMAWAMLGHLYSDFPPAKSSYYMSKALEYSKNASEREQLYIMALFKTKQGHNDEAADLLEKLVAKYPDFSDAYRLLGHLYSGAMARDVPRAIAAFETAVKIDPGDGMSLNRLAYLYSDIGHLERALQAVERYIELDPAEANPYDTRGDILGRYGRYEEAIASYKAALARNPDFYPSLASLGCIYTARRAYGAAADCFRRLLEVNDSRSRERARFFLAAIPLYQGKLDSALVLLDEGLDADRIDRNTGEYYCSKLVAEAAILAEKGEPERAAAIVRRMISEVLEGKLEGGDEVPDCIEVLTRFDIDAARAELERMGPWKSNTSDPNYQIAEAWVRLREGHPERAIEILKPITIANSLYEYLYPRALAFYQMKRYDEARRCFERLLDYYYHDRVKMAIRAVRCRFYLGKVYEKLGMFEKAAEQYREFRATWKDADTELALEVEQARRRIDSLSAEGEINQRLLHSSPR